MDASKKQFGFKLMTLYELQDAGMKKSRVGTASRLLCKEVNLPPRLAVCERVLPNEVKYCFPKIPHLR